MSPEHYKDLLEMLKTRFRLALSDCHDSLDIGDVRDLFEEALAEQYDGDYRRPH